MSHSECTGNPLTCDKSDFREQWFLGGQIFRRWVVCTEYYKDEYGRLLECDWHYRSESGVKIVVGKGEVCVNAPVDWWEEYLKGERCDKS